MKRHIPPVVSFFAGLLTVLGIMLVPALIGIAPVWAQGGWQLVLENDGTVSSSSFNRLWTYLRYGRHQTSIG